MNADSDLKGRIRVAVRSLLEAHKGKAAAITWDQIARALRVTLNLPHEHTTIRRRAQEAVKALRKEERIPLFSHSSVGVWWGENAAEWKLHRRDRISRIRDLAEDLRASDPMLAESILGQIRLSEAT